MQGKDASEQELTYIAPDHLATALLSSEERDASPNFPPQRNSKVRDFLRHTRLQILGKAFNRITDWPHEPRKVAMYRSRRVAAFHCVLHMIPLAGAITLLVLRWTEYWIGHKSPDATTLQFTAKFHELLMQVSIVEVMLCIIRRQATKGFVPLGALSGGVQATQLSYLWSLDFWSLFTSDAFHGQRWQKAGMIIMIPTLLISTALVGPSSAVLMIPDSGCPARERIGTLLAKPTESLFPSDLGVAEGMLMNTTSMYSVLERFKARAVYARLSENEILCPDLRAMDRMLRLSVPEPYAMNSTLNDRNIIRYVEQATATIPTNFANQVLLDGYTTSGDAELSEAVNATGSVTMPQPVLDVICIAPRLGRIGSSESVYYMKKDGSSLGVLGNISSLASQIGSKVYTIADKDYLAFEPVWFNSPEPESQSSVVALLGGRSHSSNLTELGPLDELLTDPNWDFGVTSCSLSAYWTTVEASFSIDQGDLLTIRTEPISKLDLRNARVITLNTSEIDMLHDPNYLKAMDYSSPHTDLAVALALSISDVPLYDQDEWVSLYDNWTQYDMTGYSIFEPVFTRYAYGYCTNTTSIRLSLAVILAYCIIVVSYLLYILATGSTSTAWNSAIELVALALQSRKPNYPGHTAVGIDSINTFNQSVGIRVNNDNELELVFASDRDIGTMGLRKIEHNKAY